MYNWSRNYYIKIRYVPDKPEPGAVLQVKYKIVQQFMFLKNA